MIGFKFFNMWMIDVEEEFHVVSSYDVNLDEFEIFQRMFTEFC